LGREYWRRISGLLRAALEWIEPVTEDITAMKTLLLASALALTTAGAAFASITTYTDGSTYNSATGVTSPPAATYAMGGQQTVTDVPFWHRNNDNDPKVVRWGPPESGLGGG
jgi:hypothetical protein